MFFDFSLFGPLAYVLMIGFFIWWVVIPGIKRSSKRRRFLSDDTASENTEIEKGHWYPEGTIIHRNYSVVRPFAREWQKNYIKTRDYILTGDYMRNCGDRKEVFINTAMEFIGYTIIHLSYTHNYGGLKNGTTSLSLIEDEKLDFLLCAEYIKSIDRYLAGNMYFMKLHIEDPDGKCPPEMVFVFHGADAEEMSRKAEEKLMQKRAEGLEIEKNIEKNKNKN